LPVTVTEFRVLTGKITEDFSAPPKGRVQDFVDYAEPSASLKIEVFPATEPTPPQLKPPRHLPHDQDST